MIRRARIILSASVTWLTVAGAIATIVMEELAPFPAAAEAASRIAIILATATAIIRRVSPVAPAHRGIG